MSKPIDVSHHVQLFLDDFLVEESINIKRTFHKAQKSTLNPMIVPEQPIEMRYKYHYGWDGGSVIYDDEKDIFRAYFSIAQKDTLYAESKDGINWGKPELNRMEYAGSDENNILLEACSCSTVMADGDGEYKYKMYTIKRGTGACMLFSNDGLNWEDHGVRIKTPMSDTASCSYDPYNDRYIAIIKTRYPIGKIVTNPLTAEDWDVPIRVLGLSTWDKETGKWSEWQEVLRPDEKDHKSAEERYPAVFVEGIIYPWRMRPEFEEAHKKARETRFLERLTVPPQTGFHHMDFMNMVVIPYHNLYIGLIQVLHTTAQVFDFGAIGVPRKDNPGQDGTMEVQLVVSRDLINWERLGDRSAFISLGGLNDWDRGMISPFTTNHIVKDGELQLYYAGFRQSHRCNSLWGIPKDYKEEVGGIGIATIREDGFSSFDAGEKEGMLLTKQIVFNGNKLIINADARGGWIKAEIRDDKGHAVQGFGKKDCTPFEADKIKHEVFWGEKSDLSTLRGQKIQLCLYMENAKIYSFAFGE